MKRPTTEPERLDLNSDRARRIAENLARVFAEVELAIQERRRQAQREQQ